MGEKEVYKELSTWLKTYDVDSWINHGEKKFKIIGERRKPDMVIYSKKLNEYIAIEVKQGHISHDIYNATKIIDYLNDYNTNNVQYIINDHHIKISSFVVASVYSIFGHLFMDEGGEAIDSVNKEHNNKQWGQLNNRHHIEPRWEYPKTHMYLRQLWANWKRIRERKEGPGVGIILNDTLNKNELTYSIDKPIVFDIHWNNQINKWRVRQKWL